MNFNGDYFEIRLESIGGLGANLAGKILGEIGALYLNLNAASFSSYGSEKRGSPVKSFIRYAKENTPIRINSPVEVPELLGIFHIGLAGKEGLMAGVSENTSVVINSEKEAEEIRNILKMYAGKLYCIDALKIAIETNSRINMVMLGAIAKASKFIPLEKVEEAIKNTIGKKYPKALESNLNAVKRGYEEVLFKEFAPDGKYEYEVYKELEREWGYENAPIGGVNPAFGSTISNDLSSSREGYVPIFDIEKCIQCGFCDSTCPDMVFQFVAGEYKGKKTMVNLGPDYHHCKGCLRCTEICPTKALTVGIERDVDLSKTHIRNQSLILNKLQFEDVGANSYITSETNKDDLNV